MRCTAQGELITGCKCVCTAQPAFAVVYHRIAAPQYPVGAERVGQRSGVAQPRLPLLNATLCCGLEFFLLHGKLCLPTGQFPTGHIIGKLLLSHHQTTRRYIQTVLHRILAALFQLGQHPQKLCTVRHG